MNTTDITGLNDRKLIAELVYRWAMARDSDDWGALRGCFHDDGQIHISWINSTADDFVRRSAAMAAARRPGSHMKHIIATPWVETRGQRGFCRSNAILHIRDCVQGVWFDIESHIRFFDRVERRDGVWRIVDRTALYDKDRIDLVNTGGVPHAFMDEVSTSKHLAAARCLCWWLANKGLEPLTDMIPVYSPEETQLREQCLAWMRA